MLPVDEMRAAVGGFAGLEEERVALLPDRRRLERDHGAKPEPPRPEGPLRQVSIGGGQMPVFNRNGRELFYAARNGTLMSVPLRLDGGRLEAGEPQPLFPLQFDLGGELPWHLQPYDVSPDGQRFLVIRRAPGVEPNGVVVVTNWSAVLRAR